MKNILDLHGGSYGVESELGKGSTFWFELKLAEETTTLPDPAGSCTLTFLKDCSIMGKSTLFN